MGASCCPLSGNETGAHAKVIETRNIQARRYHRCCECGDIIHKGEYYEQTKGLWENRWDTFRTCLPCRDIRSHFECGNGWIYGELWPDLEENFFPDMRAGGKCMDGLSPIGKNKLFERRTDWVFEQDEWEPEGFALPPSLQPQKPRKFVVERSDD